MNFKKMIKRVVVSTTLALSMIVSSGITASANTSAQAYAKLGTYVGSAGNDANLNDGKGKDKIYMLEGGGTATYENIVDANGIPTNTFAQLTAKDKEECLSDMIGYADEAIKNYSSSDGVTEDVKTTWLEDVQSCNGVGPQLLSTLLQNTKPDYATANRIYAPFSGVVGTILALASILILAFLTISIGLDLAYIAIPFVRLMFGDSNDRPKVISYEAYSAVQEAENGGSGDGKGNKVAVGQYFKKKVVAIIILCICLLYLIQGQIFTLVGWILNLLRGFLGF